jgi:hypothetical protein
MEGAFGGEDFSGVRVHDGGAAAGASSAYGARAFTVGSDIAFGASEYEPATPAGDALLAHELAHVVQQRSARGPVDMQAAPDTALEDDADLAGVHVVARLWSGVGGALASFGQSVVPALRSGLRLSASPKSCGGTERPNITKTVGILNFPGAKLDSASSLSGASQIWQKGAGITLAAGATKTVSEEEAKALIGQEAGEKDKPASQLSMEYELAPFEPRTSENAAVRSAADKLKGDVNAVFLPDIHGTISPSIRDSKSNRVVFIAGQKCGTPGFALAHEAGHVLIDPNMLVKGHNFSSSLMTSLDSDCRLGIDSDEADKARGGA